MDLIDRYLSDSSTGTGCLKIRAKKPRLEKQYEKPYEYENDPITTIDLDSEEEFLRDSPPKMGQSSSSNKKTQSFEKFRQLEVNRERRLQETRAPPEIQARGKNIDQHLNYDFFEPKIRYWIIFVIKF